MTTDQFLSIIRGIINLGGGALVTQGVMSGGTAATIGGVVLNVASLAWGVFVHSDVQTVRAAEIVKYNDINSKL